ncbi:zinc-ribbon domain-containing protein [Tepidibacter mesophilus]|uniref:zinc-ribbon domain-containing protein n=1 Tax=Tepidibacter mesophilus TaxID=655607 RepID=UPI000C07B2C1|nr:zinc-ribbon domain-containing protein [Tepidibacter mesophilus]
MKRKIDINKSLTKVNPRLAKEWHPTKNKELTPSDVSIGSGKKVWWKCDKHEWQATVLNRSNGNKCPYCSGKKASKDNSLAKVNPKLVKQWHFDKNKNINPNDVLPNSRKKVWWKCDKHEWQATIYRRNNGTGCPYCSGKKVSKDNSLAKVNPELSKQWNFDKNEDLTPYDVTANSGKKVWWKCEEHEWEAPVYRRNNGTGCPFCFKKRRKKSKK